MEKEIVLENNKITYAKWELNLNETKFNELWALRPDYFQSCKIFGKEIELPRRHKTFGINYNFNGSDSEVLPFNDIINVYLEFLKRMYVGDDVPNSCLVNWYNDGNEYIGYHTDDETDLVQNKDIYIFSLYDRYNIPRKFKFQSKTTKKITTLELEGGSLLIIPSAVQKTHKHSLPKMKNYPFQRISLTFRYVKEPESYVLK